MFEPFYLAVNNQTVIYSNDKKIWNTINNTHLIIDNNNWIIIYPSENVGLVTICYNNNIYSISSNIETIYSLDMKTWTKQKPGFLKKVLFKIFN